MVHYNHAKNGNNRLSRFGKENPGLRIFRRNHRMGFYILLCTAFMQKIKKILISVSERNCRPTYNKLTTGVILQEHYGVTIGGQISRIRRYILMNPRKF